MKTFNTNNAEGSKPPSRGRRRLNAVRSRARLIAVFAIFAVVGGSIAVVSSLDTSKDAAFANVNNLNYTGNDANGSNQAVLSSFEVTQINGTTPVLATTAEKAGVVETSNIHRSVIKYSVAAGQSITYQAVLKRSDNPDNSYRVGVLFPKDSTPNAASGLGWNCFNVDPSVYVSDPNYQFGGSCWKTIDYSASSPQTVTTLLLTVTMDSDLPNFHPIQVYWWNMACAPGSPCYACLDVIANPDGWTPPAVPPVLNTVKSLTKVNGVTAVMGQTVKPNDVLTYQLKVTNSGGPMASMDQPIYETVPIGTTYRGIASPGELWAGCVEPTGSGLGSAAGTACTNRVMMGASPDFRELTFTVVVDALIPDSLREIQNAATGTGCTPTVTSCSPPPNPLPPIVVPPGLTTVKTLAKVNGVQATPHQQVQSADVLTYTLTTTNTGGAMTAAMQLSDIVPVGTTYKGQSSPTELWSNCVAPVGAGLGSAAGTACTHEVMLGASPASVVSTFTVVVDAVIPASLTQIKNVATGPGCTPTESSCSPPPNPLPVNPVLATVKSLTTVNGSAATAGQTVRPLDVLTYTLTTTNTGGPMMTAQTMTDTVPVGTTYRGTATPGEGWGGCVASSSSSLGSAAGTACTHSVMLAASPASVVLTFTVVVDAIIPVTLRQITNVATGPGCTPSVTSCSPPPNPLPPLVPGFTVLKDVTTVNAGHAKPGEVVTYTVLITNTGETAYTGGPTDTVWFDDDLTAVLDDSAYNNDATFVSSNSNGAGAFTYKDSHLSWRGALAYRGTVMATYSVTVLARDSVTGKYHEGSNQWLDNRVTSNPESNCVPIPIPASGTTPVDVPAECKTRTPVQSFITSKVASATTLKAGDKLTYIVTVKNDGQFAYSAQSPASFTDSLVKVLANADYNNDADSGATYTAPVISWSGALAVGGSITVTYSVTAKLVQTGNHLLVNDVTTPSEGGCDAAALGTLNLVGTRPDSCQVTTKLTDTPLPVVSA